MGIIHGVTHFVSLLAGSFDTFTRVDSPVLGQAEVGGPWTVQAGNLGIADDMAFCNMAPATGQAVATIALPLPLGQITCDVYLSPGHSHVGLVAKCSNGVLGATHVYFQLILTQAPQNTSNLGKKVGGVNTSWALTNPQGLVAGNGYTLTMLVTATTVSCWIDDIQVANYTLTAQDLIDLPDSQCGIRSAFGVAIDDDGGSRFDNYSAQPFPVFTPRVPAQWQNPPVASATGASTALVTWVKSGNGGSPILSYRVQSSHGEVYAGISPAALSFAPAGLASVPQSFTVTAVNAVGEITSAPSAVITPTGLNVPTAPTLASAGVGVTSANIGWTTPVSNGGSPILSYLVSEVSPSPEAHTATVAAPATSVTVTGLVAGTSYTFNVTAINTVGSSPPSNTTNAVVPTPAGSVGGLAAVQAGQGMYPGDQGLESNKVILYKNGGSGGPYVRQSLYKWVVDFTAFGPPGSPNGSLATSTFGIFQSAGAWQAFQTAAPIPGLPTPRMSLEVGLSVGTNGMSAAARSASLAATAAGTNDGPYTNLANAMIAAGYGNGCIRLGHENNAGDYPWGTLGFTPADDANFINAYRRIVGVMRAAPGANFIFDFCGLASVPFKTSQYPGDAFVDVIGADFYDVTRVDGITIAAYIANLAQWRDFAISRGKKFSIPEWGCSATNGGKSGAGTVAGDNPDFITAVYNFCFNLPATGGGSLAYQSYFQTDPPSEGLICLKNFPAARAVYTSLFGQ